MRKVGLAGHLLLLWCGALACLPCACAPTTKGPAGFSPASRDGRPGCAVAIEYSGELAPYGETREAAGDKTREAITEAFREAGFAIDADAGVAVTIGVTQSMGTFYRMWGALARYSAFIYPAYFPVKVTVAGTSGGRTVTVTGEYRVGVWLPAAPFLAESYEKTWLSVVRDSTLGIIGKMQAEGLLPVP